MHLNQKIILTAVLSIGLNSHVIAQADEQLCQLALKPEVAKMTLHWDNFNRYGNERSKDVESGYVMGGEGAACRIVSDRTAGAKVRRACTWTPRMTCDLQMGKEPVPHKFSTGSSTHEGTLAWTGNDKIKVNLKQGDAVTTVVRDVAVVKFKGMWKVNSDTGTSTSTVYYDRDWGIMLKAEGWNGGNQWGNTISLVETTP